MTEIGEIAQTPGAQSNARSLWSHLNGAVLRRAALFALILGSVLTLANQPSAIFGARSVELLPLTLVFLTPFVVVVISQLLGIRQAIADRLRRTAQAVEQVPIFSTALSHGIPMRATLVGLLMGCINTAIVVTAAVLEHGSPGVLPLPLLAQAVGLPILFGVLSQTISYRRTIAALNRRAAGR